MNRTNRTAIDSVTIIPNWHTREDNHAPHGGPVRLEGLPITLI